MIVDTHVHVVSSDREAYPQREKPPPWPPTPVESLVSMMDTVGIDRALLVQTYFTYGFDNSYVADSANAHSDRFLAVAVLDPMSKDSPDRLSAMVETCFVRGIRIMADAELAPAIDADAAQPLWARAAELGIPVCVASLIGDVHRMHVPLAKHPDLIVAMDHIWGLEVGDGPDHALLQPLHELARYPNVHVKIAPNNSFALRKVNSTPEALYGALVERFGAKRMMWGSNYPAHTQTFGTLAERFELGRKDLAFLSAKDRNWIFGETALRLWSGLR